MKKGRRWLALILAVALVSSNALYQLGTQMSASESESDQQTVSAEGEAQSQETTVDTAEAEAQPDDQSVQVQEVQPEEQPASDQQKVEAEEQTAEQPEDQAQEEEAAAASEESQEPETQTFDVKIQSSDVDGGQVVAWGADGAREAVSYDGNGQYVKTVNEGENFGFEVTANDTYKVASVTDQNGTAIQPAAVNGNVYTYEVANITSERIFNIVYNKEETQTTTNNDQKKSDDEKSDDADDEGDSAKVKTQSQSEAKPAVQSANAAETVKIGKTITLTGTSGSSPKWESSNTAVATVSGNRNTATVKGVAAGSATITYTYKTRGGMNPSNKTETWTVNVLPADKLTKVEISGKGTVKAFDKIQLTATVTPSDAEADYTWESSDTSVLTVDANGNVTTYKEGTATVTVRATGYDADKTVVSATKEITVEAATTSTDEAIFYYLISPTADPDSNATSAWGPSLGNGTITTANATWVNNKNSFDNVGSRVISWPSTNGTAVDGGFELTRESTNWNTIFDNYQSEIASKYPGQTITKDDVEAIILHPYKISKNNSSNPDKHVDCTVEIKIKNFYTATYKLQDAGTTTGYVWKEGDTYREGETTSPTGYYPTEKYVNGVKYTFSGWYDNESLSGTPVEFPYEMKSNVTFYAKYVAGYNVTYDLAGGTWNKAQNTEYYQVGNTVYVTGIVPTRDKYTFEGWTYSEDDSKTYWSNDRFTMPEKNVTLTAKWKENKIEDYLNLVPEDVEKLYDGKTYTSGTATVSAKKEDADLEGVKIEYQKKDGTWTEDPSEITAKNVTDSMIVNVRVTSDKYTGELTTTQKLTINPRTVTLTSGTASKKYDGKVLTKKEVKESGDGFIDGEGAEYDVTGKQKVVGSSENTFTYELKEGTLEENYTITKVLGTLTVTNRDAQYKITVVANSATATYDGKDHSAKGLKTTTFVVDGETYTVSGLVTEDPTQRDAGTYTNNITGTAVVKDADGNDVTDQFAVKTENGKLVINKAKVTLKSADLSKQYDGDALVNGNTALATETGWVGNDGASYIFTGSQTLVGSSANAFSYTVNTGTNADNYDISKEEGTLTVTNRDAKYEITVVANSTTTTYDGKKHSAKGVESNEFTINGKTYTVSGLTTEDPEEKNAGTYTNNITGTAVVKDAKGNDVTSQFAVKTENGKLEIAKRNVTLKSADLSKKYDGKALVNGDTALETETGWAEGEGATYTFTGSQTIVGSSANAFSYKLNKGTNEANYTIAKTEGTLTVTNRDAKYAITVTANSATATYDGKEHSAKGLQTTTFVVNGETYTVSGLTTEDPTQKNAGTYSNNITGTAVVKDAKGRDVTSQFAVSTVNGSLVIDKATVTLKSADLSKEYDGKALVNGNTALETETGWAEGEGASYTFTGSQTLVGSSENAFNYSLNSNTSIENYTIVKTEGTLTVTNRGVKYAITIVANSATTTYDGQPHSAKGVESNTFTINGKQYTVSGLTTEDPTYKNAGTYTNNITGTAVVKDADGNDVTSQFAVKTENGKLEIAKRSVTLKSKDLSKKYDGKALVNGNEALAVEDGWVSGEGATYTFTGSQTIVGSSTNAFSYSLNSNTNADNYDISKEEGTLTVTNRDAQYKITVTANSAKATYDGTEHSAKGLQTTTFVVDGETYTVSGLTTEDPTQRDAGIYTNNILGTAVVKDADGNDVTSQFAVSTENGSLVIDKADVTLKSADLSKVYDGKALTNGNTALVTETGWAESDKAAVSYEFTGSQTEVGHSENKFSVKWNDTVKESNYNVSIEFGTLTVAAQSIVPDPENPTPSYKGILIDAPEDHIYDGAEHKWIPTVTDAEGNELVEGIDYEVSYNKTDYTNVTGAIEVTITGKGNYTGSVTKSYQITPVSVSISTDSADKVYDGKPLTADGRIEGLVNNETVEFKVTGSQTEVGSSSNTYELNWTGTAKKSNYQIVSEEIGTLVVKENAEEIVVTTVGGTFTYDGLVHGATVSVSELPEGYTLETATSDASAKDVTGKNGITATADNLVIRNAAGEDVTDKLNIKKIDGTIIVNPAAVTIETPDASKVYDGTALTAEGTIKGLVNGETVTFKTTGTITDEGSTENTYTLTWDGTAKASNYTVSDTIGTLTITKQSIVPGPDPENPDPNYKGIQINDPSDVPYNGQKQKWTPTVTDATGNVLTEGTDYEVSYDKDDFTNVTGAIEVTITGKGNYTGSVTKSYQITPVSVSISTDSADKVYDGKPLTADGRIEGLVNNETVEFKVTGRQTEVGSSSNTYELNWTGTAKKSNYQIVSEEIGTLVVKENAKEIVVTTVGGTFTYDGLNHGATVSVSELPEGYTLETATSDASAKDVTGKNGIAATADNLVIRNAAGEDVTDKLNIEKIDGTIIVNPAAVTIETPDASKVYDGTALTAEGTIKGLVNGETVTFKTTGSQTEVGDSKNTYELKWNGTAKESNYTVSDTIGTLKVTKQSIVPDPENPESYKDIRINDPSDVPYNGQKQKWTPTVTDATGNVLTEGTDYEVSYDKDDFTNVTGNITVTITGKGNYTGTVDKVYKITPRTVTIKTDSAEKVFDNVPLTAPGRVDGIVAGETYEFTVTGTQTYVGTSVNNYEMTWAAKDNKYTAKKSNYNVTVETGLLKVTDGTPENPVDPSLVVNKTHDESKEYKVGDVVEFTITAKNIYKEAKTITLREQEGVTLDQTTFENVEPGQEITATATYTVTEADIIRGTFTNKVEAAFSGVDKTYEATDTVDEFEKTNPHMTITKTTSGADENHVYKLGETINYEITVENDGNLTLTNVKVEDALTGNVGENAWMIDTFAPGEKRTFTTSYEVTEEDVLNGKVLNEATGEATSPDPDKTPEIVPGTKEDPVETPNPSLAVIKTSDKTGEVKLGEEITYTVTVTNNGNVTIKDIKVTDELTGNTGDEALAIDGGLKPGQSKSVTTTYVVTEKDILAGEIKNVAIAAGKDPENKEVKAEGEKTDKTEAGNPELTVTKETTSTPENGETYALGEEITYKITVKNTGNLTLTDVKVIDELTGLNKTIEGEFKPGDEKTFKTSYTVKESDLGKTVVNVATAEGTSPDPKKPEPEVTPGETEDPTDPKNPAMSITKKVVDKKDEYQIGDTVVYEITVENTGNTTQNNILVEDQMKAAGAAKITKVEGAKGTIDGANVTLDTLAPGKTATITAEYTVVKEDRGNTITNAAVAKGEGENPETPEVPVDVEDVYDIHVEHVFADGEEGYVALPDDYDIENLKPGTNKILEAEAVEGYVAYPSTKTATIENEDVTVTFIYYKDSIGTDPTNPDQPDNIPDRYQVVVRFEAINGTVTHDHAVVTLFDENNEPAEHGVGHLSFFQIAGAKANDGYRQSSLTWAPETPTTRYEIIGEMTFTARFTAVPENPTDPTDPTTPDNPTTPTTPTNPTTPDDSTTPTTPTNPGVIDRLTNTIGNVPQNAANTIRNIVADVNEVFNSDDGNVPLANQKLDDHKCCILHFLIMLITAILYGFFTHNMKKRQKKNFELREELDTELAKRGLPTSREQEAK